MNIDCRWRRLVHFKPSTKVSVQHKALQRNIKVATPTCRKQVTGTTHEGDNGHHAPNGDFKTPTKDDYKYVTPYRGIVESVKRDNGTSPTREWDNNVKTPQEKNFYNWRGSFK